ncbi:MAG TPA: hypothetical protein PLH57_00535 [Oligoflexia bacterium]|nr:hypothetical protein [Oligoflexia bacterium]
MTKLFRRWLGDLKENFSANKGGVLSGTRSWERDFSGDIHSNDAQYGVFLGALSLIPALATAYLWSHSLPPPPRVHVMAHLFGAPLQFVITGFLCSVLFFLGSHVNRAPKIYPVAFKLMLRVMAVYPILATMFYFRFGGVFVLLLFGVFVIRGALRTYRIPKANVIIFFGIAYVTFALLQLQNAISPPLDRPQKKLIQQNENR